MKRFALTLIFVFSGAALAAEASPASAEAKATSAATASLSATKEVDIPVHLEPTKKASSSDSPWMRMLFGLAIVGAMSCGAYIFIKRSKYANKSSSLAPEIKVLTQHHLGPKRSLAIIRVAGESILIGVTDQNINLIKSLALLDEDIPETVPQDFETVFGKVGGASANLEISTNNADDEFSISGIKDVVTTRLKNLRNL